MDEVRYHRDVPDNRFDLFYHYWVGIPSQDELRTIKIEVDKLLALTDEEFAVHRRTASCLLGCLKNEHYHPYFHDEVSCQCDDCRELLQDVIHLLGNPPRRPPQPKPPTIGFVYLMKNIRNELYKIGFSTKPNVRERTLQSEEPEIALVCCREGTVAHEHALHAKYHDKRVRGEWFRLSLNDVLEISGGFRTYLDE